MCFARKSGLALVSVLVLLSVIGTLLCLEIYKTKSVYAVTQAIAAQRQEYALSRSLSHITQEAVLSYVEPSVAGASVSFKAHLQQHLDLLKDQTGLTVKTVAAPDTLAQIASYPATKFTYFSTLQHQDYGLQLSQYLEGGPYALLGKEQIVLQAGAKKQPITVASFALPVTNFGVIGYRLSPVSTVNRQHTKLQLGGQTRALYLSQGAMPYYYRYISSLCYHLFQEIWSDAYKDYFLQKAYSEGYFSQKSWPVKSFPGIVYDENNNQLTINLDVWTGNYLAIVDQTGGLSVDITGGNEAQRPLILYVISYTARPVQLHLPPTGNSRLMICYLVQAQLHFTYFRGAIFADPQTQLFVPNGTLWGSLFYDASSPCLQSVDHLRVIEEAAIKARLKEHSPHVVLSKARLEQ